MGGQGASLSLRRVPKASGFLFEEIGGFHVSHRQGESQRILGEGFAYETAVFRPGKAHVPADGHGLFSRQADEAVDHVDGFFPVAIGHGVFILIRRDLGPLAVLPLHVAGGGLVAADLAHVMQQGHQRNRLLAVLQPI